LHTSVSMYISIKTYITDIFALYYRYSLFTVSILQLKNDFKTPIQHFVRKPSRLWSFAFHKKLHTAICGLGQSSISWFNGFKWDSAISNPCSFMGMKLDVGWWCSNFIQSNSCFINPTCPMFVGQYSWSTATNIFFPVQKKWPHKASGANCPSFLGDSVLPATSFFVDLPPFGNLT